VADAVSCVEDLAKEGLIDLNRVGIAGHSAGGYATMQALCEYPDVWTAGIAESGLSDMQAMFEETHKFESHYLQPLCFEADTLLPTSGNGSSRSAVPYTGPETSRLQC
jgi:poly(3-hydroxybutyrate) depolymerase